MRLFGCKVTNFVAILVLTFADICIADTANVLTLHAIVLAIYFLPAFVTEDIILTVTIRYLLIADLTIMLVNAFMITVDDFIAIIAIIILVIIQVIANEFFSASVFVAISVLIIIEAIKR